MSTKETRKPSLDTALDAIRADEPSAAEVSAAAARVRRELGLTAPAVRPATAHIESCAGFQALIPSYLDGSLAREAVLLLEEHSRECIPCRRAIKDAREPRTTRSLPAAASRRTPYGRWAAAAVAAAAVILASYAAWQILPGLTADPHFAVLRADGAVYQLRGGAPVPLHAGMTVGARDPVRTAGGASALLRMDDGSSVEMRERSEVAVRPRRDGATVGLRNGSIIVEASPQGAGHLDVRTDDCLVSVKGTIFAVNHGTKGSRVSVVEGAVDVDTGGSRRLLRPGDQVATSDAVAPVAVSDEIAWSKDAARYDRLLRELASLREDLNARVPSPALRYGSDLLDKIPPGTVVYAAIPNLTDALVSARQIFLEHVAQSGELQAWWDRHMGTVDEQRKVDEAFDRLRSLGSQLGDEIVVAFTQDVSGHVHGPIVLSKVADPEAFRAQLAAGAGGSSPDVSLRFDGSVAILTPKGGATAGSPQADDPGFRDRLKAAYADGVSWLFGADLKAILAQAAAQARAGDAADAHKADVWARMGILDARYVIAERADDPTGATNRAEISFAGARSGLASWLAPPAPIGSLDFVSPDAGFAAAAVVKRPELVLADVLSWAVPSNDAPGRLDTGEGLARLQDVARTLGGDVAVALDGPVLPVPAWKVIVEVDDPVGFQSSFERLVAWVNERIAASGNAGRVELTREDVGNRTDWSLRIKGMHGTEATAKTMRYTIRDGYLIAAPGRVLLDRAIEQRANGYRLAASRAFTDLLPKDGHVNVSAVVWQHMGPALEPIASGVKNVVAVGDRNLLSALASQSRPSLVAAYAGDDRIEIGSRDQTGLGGMLASLVSVDTMGELGRALHEAQRAAPAEAPSTP